jgi:hypothetical protein
MKKRILALCMAMSLAFTLNTGIQAQEIQTGTEDQQQVQWISEDDDTGLSDGNAAGDGSAAEETESASSAVPDGEAGDDIVVTDDTEVPIDAEDSADEFLIDVEEVTETADAMEFAEASDGDVLLTETVSDTVSHSGLASDATIPSSKGYRSGVFPGDYGSQLDTLARNAYEAMKAAWYTKRGYASVSVSISPKLTFTVEGSPTASSKTESSSYQEALLEMHNVFQTAYDALSYDYPEIYWLDIIRWEYKISWVKSGENSVGTITSATIIPTYAWSGAAGVISSFDVAVNSAYQSIASTLSGTATQEDKVLAIHDWICGRVYYDYGDRTYAHSAAGVFCYPSYGVVCEGYAKAMKILCRKFGLNCVLVAGEASGESHMWNYVQMENNNWYLVDVTWDDGTSISYDYFLTGSKKDLNQVTRILAPNFNSSAYSMSFTYPVLNYLSYPDSVGEHEHTWVLRQEQSPTCVLTGYRFYQCTGCGTMSGEMLDQLHHSYKNNLYVYNGDGTKSLVCDYGCGTVLLTVKVTAQCNVSSLKLKTGQSTTKVKVTLESGDTVASWKSSNTGIVKVTGKKNGTCTIKAQKKTGTATITATLKSGLTKTIQVTVQKKAVTTTKITGVPSTLSLKAGAKKTLAAVVSPITSTQKLTYQSSNKKIATVSSKGVITAKKKGTATITVQSGSKKVKCKITVS